MVRKPGTAGEGQEDTDIALLRPRGGRGGGRHLRGRSREIRPHRQEGGMRGGGRFHRRRIVASSARAIERRRRRSRTTSAAFGGDDEKAKGGGGSARSHRSGGPPATSRGRLRGDVPDQRSAREQCRIYRSNRGRGFMAHNITRSLIDSTIYSRTNSSIRRACTGTARQVDSGC